MNLHLPLYPTRNAPSCGPSAWHAPHGPGSSVHGSRHDEQTRHAHCQRLLGPAGAHQAPVPQRRTGAVQLTPFLPECLWVCSLTAPTPARVRVRAGLLMLLIRLGYKVILVLCRWYSASNGGLFRCCILGVKPNSFCATLNVTHQKLTCVCVCVCICVCVCVWVCFLVWFGFAFSALMFLCHRWELGLQVQVPPQRAWTLCLHPLSLCSLAQHKYAVAWGVCESTASHNSSTACSIHTLGSQCLWRWGAYRVYADQ